MFKEKLGTEVHKSLDLSVIKEQLGQRNGIFRSLLESEQKRLLTSR